tara:strand:+ start:438 stop:656 length:219 start_codon:yes stop_codon:yes gene_type:complete
MKFVVGVMQRGGADVEIRDMMPTADNERLLGMYPGAQSAKLRIVEIMGRYQIRGYAVKRNRHYTRLQARRSA